MSPKVIAELANSFLTHKITSHSGSPATSTRPKKGTERLERFRKVSDVLRRAGRLILFHKNVTFLILQLRCPVICRNCDVYACIAIRQNPLAVSRSRNKIPRVTTICLNETQTYDLIFPTLSRRSGLSGRFTHTTNEEHFRQIHARPASR